MTNEDSVPTISTSSSPSRHLVNGLEAALLAAPLDPVIGPEVLHVLQHESDPCRHLALLDNLGNPVEVLINTLLWEEDKQKQ